VADDRVPSIRLWSSTAHPTVALSTDSASAADLASGGETLVGLRIAAPHRPAAGMGGTQMRRWVSTLRQSAADRGTATAEYAIATLAACAFAGLLLAILRSGEVRGLLFGIVRRALSVG
jgi:hypothetical protein